MRLNFEAGTLDLKVNGQWRSRVLLADLDIQEPNARSIAVDWARDRMVVGLPSGRDATIELGSDDRDSGEALDGRAVLYLDQNKFSALASWRYGHRPVPADDADAAARLLQLVEARQVVVPMSSAHLYETVPLFGERRTFLGAAMLEFSRGWQLSNPFDVRRAELTNAIAGRDPVATNVFNRGIDVLFTRRLKQVAPLDNPAITDTQFARLVNFTSVVTTVLEPGSLPNPEGRQAAKAWAEGWAVVASKMKADSLTSERFRMAVHGVLLADFAGEIAALARETEVVDWIARSAEDVERMPYLGRYRELLYGRLTNGPGGWRANDMTDMHFLSCAAGYADFVVGEKRTVGNLQTLGRVVPGARLGTSLKAAVDALETGAT